MLLIARSRSVATSSKQSGRSPSSKWPSVSLTPPFRLRIRASDNAAANQRAIGYISRNRFASANMLAPLVAE